MVTTLPPDPGPHSHPSPSLRLPRHQEGSLETPGRPALVPGPAPPMVTAAIIRMGRQSRESGLSTETGLRSRPLIMRTEEGEETLITRIGGGKMNSESETRTEEDPAVIGRTGEEAETTMKEESHQVADTLPHPMVEDTDDHGLWCCSTICLFQDNTLCKLFF